MLDPFYQKQQIIEVLLWQRLQSPIALKIPLKLRKREVSPARLHSLSQRFIHPAILTAADLKKRIRGEAM